MQQAYGVLEVDDVGVVALAEDVWFHFRVPASDDVSEVAAGVDEFLHGEGRFLLRHGLSLKRVDRTTVALVCETLYGGC